MGNSSVLAYRGEIIIKRIKVRLYWSKLCKREPHTKHPSLWDSLINCFLLSRKLAPRREINPPDPFWLIPLNGNREKTQTIPTVSEEVYLPVASVVRPHSLTCLIFSLYIMYRCSTSSLHTTDNIVSIEYYEQNFCFQHSAESTARIRQCYGLLCKKSGGCQQVTSSCLPCTNHNYLTMWMDNVNGFDLEELVIGDCTYDLKILV